ncbi:MAG: hypothetical protein KW806_02655 [Candidatus Yanofskybacteria bacterium]|nr:hypothetical protein [Candidatus Yanofskybacteria bacterium]
MGIGLGILVGGLLAAGWYFVRERNGDEDEISNFEECVRAGNQILDTVPRLCKLASGKTFVEEKKPEDVFVAQNSCQTDSDCQFINADEKFSCCWVGACDVPDYSQDNWIAVNAQWFNQSRAQSCPSVSQCGSAPLCSEKTVTAAIKAAAEESFQPRCVQSVCQKVPLGK